MTSTCRATAAQATIRFLKNQYLAATESSTSFSSGCLDFSATESKPLASLCFSSSRAGVPFKHQAVPEGGGSMFVCPARSLYPNLSQCTELRAQTVLSEPNAA
jgi:hypothetical protein